MTSQTAPLEDLTSLVRPELERMNAELEHDLRPGDPDVLPLIRHAGGYRGKQLRPALVLLGGRAVGELQGEHVTVAKVVELIHTATLVHDDILDDAELRRRMPTLNALYGNEIPVLLGDYIYARAFHLSVCMEDLTCSRVLAEVTRVICQGELSQMLHRFDLEWTEERYTRVIQEKTASLYAAACRLGGHYAGGTREQVRALETYGLELGTAFQIVDDCLDLRGDEHVVGKSLGTDLAKGKLTLPLLYLLRNSPDRAVRLRELMGRADGVARLREEFALAEAVDYSMARAAEHVARGRRALDELPAGPARRAMEQLADFVLQRER